MLEQEVAREAWGLDILENIDVENASRAKNSLGLLGIFRLFTDKLHQPSRTMMVMSQNMVVKEVE